MSNRYIPFGYAFEAGQPILYPAESAIVQEIFNRYGSGESLKAIAEDLSSRKIEYSTGKTTWDKARIKRILENSKYMGADDYPAIVEREQFVSANLKKDLSNTNKLTIDEDIKLFKEMTLCAKCGSKMVRRTDSRFAEPVSWRCCECGWSIRLSDQQFKDQVIAIMNCLITDPKLVWPDEQPQEVFSLESKRLLNEFHRALDSGQAGESELIKMAFQIGAANYQAINSQGAISARLAADFGKAEPQHLFQRELFQRTVSRVHIGLGDTLSLELHNTKII